MEKYVEKWDWRKGVETNYKRWTECVKSAVMLDWTKTKYVDTFLGLAQWCTLSPNTRNVCTIFFLFSLDSCQILSPSETGFIISAHRLTKIILSTLIDTL